MLYKCNIINVYKLIILVIYLFGPITCHNNREENTRNWPVRNRFPISDHAPEERQNEKSKISNQTINIGHGIHTTSAENGANYSNQTLQNENINVSTYNGENTTRTSSTERSDNNKPMKRSSDNNKSMTLCSHCACTEGEKEIYCEHKHISKLLPHILNISADIIPKTATFIRFKDFEKLHIIPGTFTDLKLKLVNLEIINIPNIILEENSLSFNSKTEKGNIVTKVEFENCSFTDIKSGAINQIGITNYGESNEINLQNVRMLTFNFKRCNFKAIRTNAIANARIFSFGISESKIDIMETESIDIDAYENFKINNNNITSLVTNNIKIRSTHTVVFSNNDIKEIQTQAFNIKSESQVKFAYNTIHVLRKEAFTEIRPWKNEEAASIIFLENTIIKAEPLSLLLNRNYPIHERRVNDNRFHVNCNCNVTDPFQTFLGINENSTHFQNATFQTLLDKTLCQDSEISSKFINIQEYIESTCTPLNLYVVISASIASFLLLLIVVVCIVCHLRVKRAQEEANYLGEVCSTRSFSTACTSPPLSQFYENPPVYSQQIIVPDVKTYHQTELHFPYEKAEPMSASIRDSCLGQDSMVDYNTLQQNRISCPFN